MEQIDSRADHSSENCTQNSSPATILNRHQIGLRLVLIRPDGSAAYVRDVQQYTETTSCHLHDASRTTPAAYMSMPCTGQVAACEAKRLVSLLSPHATQNTSTRITYFLVRTAAMKEVIGALCQDPRTPTFQLVTHQVASERPFSGRWGKWVPSCELTSKDIVREMEGAKTESQEQEQTQSIAVDTVFDSRESFLADVELFCLASRGLTRDKKVWETESLDGRARFNEYRRDLMLILSERLIGG